MLSSNKRPSLTVSILFLFRTLSLQSFSMALSSPSTSATFEKTALVTGATDGIGLFTAKELAKKGYRVIVHGRDPTRIKNACRLVRDSGSGFATAVPAMADLSSADGRRQLATTVTTFCRTRDVELDVIVNNAGFFSSERSLVVGGGECGGELVLERTFAVNVLAPFVVTSLLLPLLTARDGSRIVFVSSMSQCDEIVDWEDGFMRRCEGGDYSAHRAYSESKLMDAMLSNEFAERLSPLGCKRITVNALDPGTVNTKMLLEGWGPCGIDVEDALDETWIASSEEVDGVSGKYFVGRIEHPPGRSARDSEQRKRLWGILSELAPDDVDKAWDKVLSRVRESAE